MPPQSPQGVEDPGARVVSLNSPATLNRVSLAVAPPANAKGGHHADGQLTNCMRPPDPGQVLVLPTAPSRPLRLPMEHLLCAQHWSRPVRSQALLQLMPATYSGKVQPQRC